MWYPVIVYLIVIHDNSIKCVLLDNIHHHCTHHTICSKDSGEAVSSSITLGYEKIK